jgi:uncharacterized protein (TIRG00374 family)
VESDLPEAKPIEQKKTASSKIRGLVSYAIILLFLTWCIAAFRTDIAQINFSSIWAAKEAILVAALLSLFNYALRVGRWVLYLTRLKHSLPIGFAAITYVAGFAFTLSPGKVGEMMRGHYYQKRGIPMSSSAAAFFVERLMDLLAMLTLAFLAVSTSSSYSLLIWITVSVIIVLLIILAFAPWQRIYHWSEARQPLPSRLNKILHGVLKTFLSAKNLLTFPVLALGFGIGLLAWGAEGVGLMMIGAIAPNVPIDWATATGIYSIAIIVGALSFLPGGLGGTEAVMIALLAAHGYPMADAIVLTFVCRLLTLWFAVAIGWLAVAALRHNSLLKKEIQ